MFIRKLIAVAAMLAGASAAQAVTVFSDNFDADIQGLNTTSFVQGWSVANGTVDTIGTGFFELLPGQGNYIDLDGSSSQAGVFSNSVSLTGGVTYTMSYAISGNMRGAGNDTVDVAFGTASNTHVIGQYDALNTMSLSFTPTTSGSYGFSFYNHGGDNQGAILDQVTITAVPEPETYAMLLAGLAAVGFAARRRRN
jgi:hypothetical protein